MKVEVEWPEPEWCENEAAVRLDTLDEEVAFFAGKWAEVGCFFPDPIKRRAEQIWKERQKLDSLTDDELWTEWCSKTGWTINPKQLKKDQLRGLRAVVKADRQREAEIRERELEETETINSWIELYNRLRERALDHVPNRRTLIDFPEAYLIPRPLPRAHDPVQSVDTFKDRDPTQYYVTWDKYTGNPFAFSPSDLDLPTQCFDYWMPLPKLPKP